MKINCKQLATKLAGFAFAISMITASGGGQTNAFMAPAHAGFFSVSGSEEIDYGKKADQEIRKQYKMSNDDAANRLVRSVGESLTPYTDRPDIKYEFRVVNDPSVNAFAVPGFVYVHTGLLDMIKNDPDKRTELAGVIAHELGHTGGRHIAKQLAEQQQAQVGASLLSILTRSRYDQVLNIGANLFLMGHSRTDEYDADRRGVRTLMRAGYDPNGMIEFFKKLQAKSKDGGKLQEYFQTHPMTSERISRVRDEIKADEQNGIPAAKSG
ncbi:MAG TPA: M48 family metallopeptidase [Capsulimonadaceae bacterium]|jgi:predicted Zn-dependent protease